MIFLPYLSGGEEGHAVASDPCDEVVTVGQQPAHQLASGIVGVGHEVVGWLQAQRVEQEDHLVEQRTVVAVGEDHAFLDAGD